MTETPTATQWYIARDGAQHGPLTDAEIRMFVQGGHMRPNDLVWRPGFTDWQPAASVFPPQPSPAPAAPAPAPTPAATPGPAPTPAQAAAPAAQSAPSPRPSNDGNQPRSEMRPRPAGPAPGASEGNKPGPAAPHRGVQAPMAASGRPQQQQQQQQEPSPSAAGRAKPAAPGPQAAHASHAISADRNDDEYADEYEDVEPARRRRFGGRATGAVIAAVAILGGGGWLVAQNQDAILAMANITTGSTNSVPVVKAEGETKTAALDQGQPAEPPAAPAEEPAAPSDPAVEAPAPTPATAETPQRPTVTPQMIDENFQRSPLWTLLKAEYPDWYNTNVEAAARIVSAGTEADMAKHLIEQLVALRRENAEHALAADTANLTSVAQAFLDNLKSLASHSASTCYSFIGQGELSPEVIALFPQRGYGEAIEAQIGAIFQAVSNGRKAPVSRVRATKADYDVLAAELTKLGWSKADLRVFADPKALAQTEPEKVCRMVQDWFTAHLAIADGAVQERLMFETLRPIVAG